MDLMKPEESTKVEKMRNSKKSRTLSKSRGLRELGPSVQELSGEGKQFDCV